MEKQCCGKPEAAKAENSACIEKEKCACSTKLCSPCLLIWGVVLAVLAINYFLAG